MKGKIPGLVLFGALMACLPVSKAEAMTTEAFLATLATIEAELSVVQAKLDVLAATEPPANVAGISAGPEALSVSVEGTEVYSFVPPSETAAMKHCEAIAFDPQYMWRQVTCTVGDTTLYDDIFVAG
jgi:hypothetical protein